MDDLLKLEISDLQSISEIKSIHKVPLPLDCAADDLLTTPRRLLALATCAHCSRERSHGRPHRFPPPPPPPPPPPLQRKLTEILAK